MDDLTVEIETPKPFTVLPNDLAELLILDEEHTTSTGDEAMDLQPVGPGPYSLGQWINEEKLVLTANDACWPGAQKIKTAAFRPITNLAALPTGEVDVIQDLAVRDMDWVKGDDTFSVITRASLRNKVLGIDTHAVPPTIEGPTPMVDQRVPMRCKLDDRAG